MAERITVENAPNQIFNVTLAGRLYEFHLKYNTCWDRWSIKISYQGVVLVGFVFLQEGIPLFANIGCMPLDFGALFLERYGQTTNHRDDLPNGNLHLEFYTDPESYAIWGHL